MRVLVVEDEIQLADAVGRGLTRQGMQVDVVYDGDDAFRKAMADPYDVLVLDRDLPGMPGDDVCRAVCERGLPTRVLMLTASGSETARAAGLALGAKDYMTKPFAFTELVQRVRALADDDPPALIGV